MIFVEEKGFFFCSKEKGIRVLFFPIKEFHERFSVTSNSYQKIDMMQKCERNLYDFGKDEKIRREFFLKTYCIRCPLLQRF